MKFLPDVNSGIISLNTRSIKDTLFGFRDTAHEFHLATKSHAQHKALDELYKGLQDLQDTIMEQVIGYTGESLSYTPDAALGLCNKINQFASTLMKWGDSNGYLNISNLSQELSGLTAQVKYFLSQTEYRNNLK